MQIKNHAATAGQSVDAFPDKNYRVLIHLSVSLSFCLNEKAKMRKPVSPSSFLIQFLAVKNLG